MINGEFDLVKEAGNLCRETWVNRVNEAKEEDQVLAVGLVQRVWKCAEGR